MAYYCCACKNIYTREDDVAIYSFPKDPILRKEWEKRIHRENLPYYAEICSNHFTPDCFHGNQFGGFLKPTALPTLMDDSPTRYKGVYLKPTALPTSNDPPTKGTHRNEVYLGPSEFSRNWAHRVYPSANAMRIVPKDKAACKEKVLSLYKERNDLKRKIAINKKCLKELQKQRFSNKNSSDSRKKLRLSNPEEGRFVKSLKTVKHPATLLERGTPNTLEENIKIKEEPEENLVIELETSKPSTTVTKFRSGTTTLVDNIKKKDPEEGDIMIQLESIIEVENAKIKTEPLSYSKQELSYLTQEYRSAIIQKCPYPIDEAILGFPQESRCAVAQKYSDSSDDAINVVHKCPDKSNDGILVLQESRCDVVQKCFNPSEDAILGVPVEYLPASSQDVSAKLEHNQSSASGSATPDNNPFLHVNDQATTSQNAPPLIPVEVVRSEIAIPVSENLFAENLVSENLSDENSMSESLSDENSMSESLSDENSMSESLSDENSMSESLSDENSMSESLSDENSMSESLSEENSMSECLCGQTSISNNRKKDEFDLFGEFVANKLRGMKRQYAIQIQSKFGDLLFKLESGDLNLQSAKIWLNNVQFE